MRISALVIVAVTLGVALPARADRRIFAYTYPYMTPPKGTLEVEHYLDLGLKGATVAWEGPTTTELARDWLHPTWQHQVELEYGITDRLDFGFYNVFQQDAEGDLRHRGVKLRSRYRFSDPGVYPVDTAVYLEYAYFGEEMEIEQRLIASKIVGPVEIAFNLMLAEELDLHAKEWEYYVLPSLGVGYHISPLLAVGAEYVGRMVVEEGEIEHYAHYLGPTLSVASGVFYWTLTAQAQLGHQSLAGVQIRSLLGIVL